MRHNGRDCAMPQLAKCMQHVLLCKNSANRLRLSTKLCGHGHSPLQSHAPMRDMPGPSSTRTSGTRSHIRRFAMRTGSADCAGNCSSISRSNLSQISGQKGFCASKSGSLVATNSLRMTRDAGGQWEVDATVPRDGGTSFDLLNQTIKAHFGVWRGGRDAIRAKWQSHGAQFGGGWTIEGGAGLRGGSGLMHLVMLASLS